MSHLDYYRFQAKARGVHSATDVQRLAEQNSYIYGQSLKNWLPDKGGRVVDLACGHGSFLWWLKQQGYTLVSGVDSSAEQVNLARTTGAEIVQADVFAWLSTQPPGSYEMVVAMDFIEHISKDDLMRFLTLTYRLLSPGGRLVLRYPNGDSPFVGLNLYNDITHVWTYTTNCLSSLARMHGFAATEFFDESLALRDHTWIKRPIVRLCQALLSLLVQGAAKQQISYWNSSIWASLRK